ncbi:hypothetical protein AKJ16_DCAP27035 [Drosera capensis]
MSRCLDLTHPPLLIYVPSFGSKASSSSNDLFLAASFLAATRRTNQIRHLPPQAVVSPSKLFRSTPINSAALISQSTKLPPSPTPRAASHAPANHQRSGNYGTRRRSIRR